MVESNILYEIFTAVTAFVDPSLNVHERIHRITEIVSSFNRNVYISSLVFSRFTKMYIFQKYLPFRCMKIRPYPLRYVLLRMI